MSNPELNPQAKTPPKPSLGYKSDLASIPGHDSGHGLPNFPNYGQPDVGGIPHVSRVEDVTPAAGGGGLLDIPGATRGERGN